MSSSIKYILFVGPLVLLAGGLFFFVSRPKPVRQLNVGAESRTEPPPAGNLQGPANTDTVSVETKPTSYNAGQLPQPQPSSSLSPNGIDLSPREPATIGFRSYPPVRKIFTDPVFGTAMMRFSDATARGDYAVHEYSQLQAFSHDNAYILMSEGGGYLVRRVADGAGTALSGLDNINTPRWHPGRPYTLVFFDTNEDETLRLQYGDVLTGEIADHYVFPEAYDRIRGNQSFDEMSDDGIWIAGMASLADGDQMIFSLNTETKQLGAQISLSQLFRGTCAPDPEYGAIEPDWIAPSPLGRYLVVNWARDGLERCAGQEVFDIQNGRFAGHSYAAHQHGDLAVTPAGKEVFVTIVNASLEDPNLPALALYELPNGAERPTPFRTIPWHGLSHISCRGPRGVCLVTSYAGEPGWAYPGVLEEELYLVFFDGSVRRLAHHRSSNCGYWVQPRASISKDGRYVAFDSDFWVETGGQHSCDRRGDELGGGEVFFLLLSDEVLRSPGNRVPLSGGAEITPESNLSDVAVNTESAPPSNLGAKGPLPISTYALKEGEQVHWQLAEKPWHARLDHTIGVPPNGDGCFDDDFIEYDVYVAENGVNEFTHIGSHNGGEYRPFIGGHEFESQGCNKGVMLYTFAPGSYRAAICITDAKDRQKKYCTSSISIVAQ